MGAAGNQSPRHFVHATTFDEARRLGEMLGHAVESALESMEWMDSLNLVVHSQYLKEELVQRDFPTAEKARQDLERARDCLESLCAQSAPHPEVRTAECDLFGAEFALTLVECARSGSLETALRQILPPEIHIFRIGERTYVAWPGEFYVEYALELRRRAPDTFLITNASGHLEGYIATQEAREKGFYEANCSVFEPQAGDQMLAATLELLARVCAGSR